jgi:nicotinic acid phosphoribosyltransferase
MNIHKIMLGYRALSTDFYKYNMMQIAELAA